MQQVVHASRAKHPTPAVFLDRDGTINIEKNYLFQYEDWEWIPGAADSIKLLRSAGFMVVVVSNQAGIARGKYLPQDVNLLHAQVQKDLQRSGTMIDAYYYCPHHPAFGAVCHCRKPAPGMFLQAAHDLNLDLSESWMVGDKAIDVESGLTAGLRSMLVQTGYGNQEMHDIASTIPVFASVVEAAQYIQSQTSALTSSSQ